MARSMNIPLIFVRHGQSEGNSTGNCSTKEQKLTKKGVQQAELLGKYLLNHQHNLPFDHVYSSDLDRVLSTAKIVMKYQSNISEEQMRILPILREKDPGIYAGKPKIDLREERAKAKAPRDHRPENGESWNDVKARAAKFLIDEVIKKQCNTKDDTSRRFDMADDGTLLLYKMPLVVTSGGFIKEFINAYVGSYQIDSSYPNCARNCSIYTFNVLIPDINNTAIFSVEMDLENHLPK
eukprot:g5108.t1